MLTTRMHDVLHKIGHGPKGNKPFNMEQYSLGYLNQFLYLKLYKE